MSESPYARLAASASSAETRVEQLLAKRWVALVCVGAVTAFVFALRYGPAAEHTSAGPDYGHYLIAANWYALADRSGEGPFDPPVVPLLFLAVSAPLGRLGALHALGPLAAAMLVPSAYYLFSRFVPRWAALVGATSFALWQQFTEFISFGGVTNLLGIAISLVLYRFYFEALEHPRAGPRPTKLDLQCALLFFALLSTHHLSAFVAGATVVLWTAVRLLLARGSRVEVAWSAARILGMSAALGAVYVPYLIDLLSGEVASGFGQPNEPGFSFTIAKFVFRDSPWIWVTYLILAATAMLRVRPRAGALPMAAGLLLTPPLLVFTVLSTHPVRGMFYEPVALVGIAAFWTVREAEWLSTPPKVAALLGPLRAFFLAFTVVAAAVLAIEAPVKEENGLSHFHQYFRPGTFEAMDFIAASTPTTAVIGVDRGISPDFNDMWMGAAMGWWIEGWANRRAVYEATVQLLPFKAKWEDAFNANRFFAADHTFENGRLRVADSFPRDDAALPRVLAGYFQDYHEFVGFSSPRLMSVAGSVNHTLQESVQPAFDLSATPTLGTLAGGFVGPGFHGNRSVSFDPNTNVVTLSMEFAFDPGAPWDTFEVSLTYPPWVKPDFSGLQGGNIGLNSTGIGEEKGSVAFALENLSAPVVAPSYLRIGEGGVGLRFNTTGSFIRMVATIAVTEVSFTAPDPHPLAYHSAIDILAQEGITHLYVGTDSTANIQRFDRQAERYARLFENKAAIIYEVRPVAP